MNKVIKSCLIIPDLLVHNYNTHNPKILRGKHCAFDYSVSKQGALFIKGKLQRDIFQHVHK